MIEQDLKEMILEKYGTVFKFSTVCGVPNSTLASIFNDHGVKKASAENLIKISNELGIDPAELWRGKIRLAEKHAPTTLKEIMGYIYYQTISFEDEPLSDSEKVLVIELLRAAENTIRALRRQEE